MTQSDPMSHSDIFLTEELLILSVGPTEDVGVRAIAAISFQHKAERWRKSSPDNIGCWVQDSAMTEAKLRLWTFYLKWNNKFSFYLS